MDSNLLQGLGLAPLVGESTARHTSWRVGGPADLFVAVPDERRLAALARTGLPLTLLGAGSNVLVADAGIRGVTATLAGDLRAVRLISEDGQPVVRAGAGAPVGALLAAARRAGLGGLGCLAGIPGTVGGAVVMNAGTSLGEIGDRLLSVRVLLDGRPVELDRRDLPMRYRDGGLPPGAIVVEARLRLEPADPAEREAIARLLARRRATQPLDRPSCGSVFRNPPGDHAGRLIEAAGLKGARIGGAVVSPRHANFIVNRGDATAADLRALMVRVRREVHRRFGVVLRPEVRPLGDWPPGAWPLPA